MSYSPEDETPAPAGAFDVVFGDFENNWRTSTRDDGEFSLDLLVPAVRSGRLDLRLSMDDMPGLALDETAFFARVRLAVDSTRPTIDSITLNGVGEGSPLSIGDANNLEVVLITNDENGFDTTEAAVLHYRVKAGEAEIHEERAASRHHAVWPAVLPSGYLDLTDSGATTLLPSYTVDVWISALTRPTPTTPSPTPWTTPSHRGPWRWLDHALTCKMRPQRSNGTCQVRSKERQPRWS